MDNKILPATTLNSHDLRELKSQLHHLKPAVVIDNGGLTDRIVQDIDLALTESELIKIRTHANNSKELSTIANEVCNKAEAILVQTIGYIIAIYRRNLVVEE
jgi:RNA-binding protein